jgi:hypothetical protein
VRPPASGSAQVPGTFPGFVPPRPGSEPYARPDTPADEPPPAPPQGPPQAAPQGPPQPAPWDAPAPWTPPAPQSAPDQALPYVYGPPPDAGQPIPPPEPVEPPADTTLTAPGKSRRGLYLILIGAAVVIVLGVATVVVMTVLNRTDANSFAVGSCVKRNGNAAVAAKCTDSGAFKITDKVASQDRCDANQPYLEIRHSGGKDEFLCLRPASTK